MPRNQNEESEIAVASTTSAHTYDDIYTVNLMEANAYNKKVDGDLSISQTNGNVTYSYNIVNFPGKNGLNLSLGLQHNSSNSMPIEVLMDRIDAYDTILPPQYTREYNSKMGSGWEFAGLKRMNSTSTYVTTRDGRVFATNSDPFDDVEYDFGKLYYLDGTVETISGRYLTCVEDKYGNKITYTYDDDNNLTLVSDDNGNEISIEYTDDYIEIKKPDNNKIRLMLTTLNITNVGSNYGYNETMPVNVISSIYDCSSNKAIASFDYISDEFIYIAYISGDLWIQDYGVFVAISEYDSPYTGMRKIDYTQATVGERPISFNHAKRMDQYMVAEKYYTGGSTTPQKTYSYEAKKGYLGETIYDIPKYLKTSELTADGKLTVTEVDKNMQSIGRPIGMSQKVYDTNGDTDVLLYETITEYHNTDASRPESVVTKSYNADDSSSYVITESSYTYDAKANMLTSVTSVDGISKNEVTNTYYNDIYGALKTSEISNADEAEITTVYTVNSMGDPLTEKTYTGDSSGTLMKEVHYTYDTNNNLTKTEVLDGTDILSSEEYEYSPDGVYLMARMSKDSQGNTLLQESYGYDDMGNIMYITNVNGTERFEYDSLNRIIKELHPDGTSKDITYYEIDRSIYVEDEISRTMEYFYNYSGLPRYIEQRYPEYSSYDFYYDAMGNANHVVDRIGGHTYITSDIFGRQTKVLYPKISGSADESVEVKYHDVFLDGGSKCSVRIIISQTGKISCEYYDLYGRLYKTVLVKNYDDFTAADFDNITAMPSDAEIVITGRYVYDNFDRVIEQYDGENRKTTYTYDIFGNVLSTTTGTGADALTVEYEYDAAGRCVKMIQGGDHITQYEYNEAGQLVKTTDPMGYTETYTYDTAGNVLTQKDKNGIITTNTYDNRGRVIKTQRLAKSIDYTYDAIGNILTSTDENGTITYEYNTDGTLYKKTYPDGKYITYDSYNKNDQVTQFTDYFGKTIQQTYNSRGMLKSVSENYSGANTVKTTTYDYNADGTLKKVNIPNQDIATLYTYDYAGNVTDVRNINIYNNYAHNRHTYTYDDSGYVLTKDEYIYGTENGVSYTYDSAGRISMEDYDSGDYTMYSYDKYNNLASEVGSKYKYYTYDKNNRLIKTQDILAYADTADGEMFGDWQTDYIYDKNGKLLYSEKWSSTDDSNQKSYSYDTFGRLILFEDDLGLDATYTYYSDGLRKSKTIGSNTLTYYYNGDNIINESLNGSNTTSYLMGADGYICRKRGSNYDFYHKDAHGDVVLVFNQAGGRVSSYISNAWGETVNWYDFYSGINQTPIRYAGQYYDYESGMTYLRARYYDSEVKRFITEDPIKDGLNWYAYCSNNPVMFVDPSGLTWDYYDSFLPIDAQNQLKGLTESYYLAGDQLDENGEPLRDRYHSRASVIRNEYLDKTYLNYAQLDFETLEITEDNFKEKLGVEDTYTYEQALYEYAMELQEYPNNYIQRTEEGYMDPGWLEAVRKLAPDYGYAVVDGTPRNNRAQNKQINDITNELKLTKDERQRLHKTISGQNYGYSEIKQIAKEMFNK